MKKTTRTQTLTIISLIIYLIWEIAVQIWAKSEPTVPIRVDLIIIYPVLLILVSISLIQQIRKTKDKN